MKFLIILMSLMFVFSGCENNLIDEPKSSTAQKVNQGTSYSNEKICFGFKKNKNAKPDIPASWQKLLLKYDGFYVGDESRKVLYLTFDEGYENGCTAGILDTLKEQNVKAAFFITGAYLDREPDLVKRMVAEGHIVGNHTENHPSMPDITDDEIKAELKELDDKFFALTGKNMSYLRPPKGEFSERTLAISQKEGYKTLLWSSAYADWDVNNQKGKDYAVNQVTSQLHSGNIILLHAVSADNANGLSDIIKMAKSQGYEFLAIDEL